MAKDTKHEQDDLKRERDKSPPDPASPSVEPEKVVTIEEQGIGANDPYPTGNPPAPVPGKPMNESPPPPEAAPKKRGA